MVLGRLICSFICVAWRVLHRTSAVECGFSEKKMKENKSG
jgi:hypothetical protein